MITETDLHESGLVIKDVEVAAFDGVKNNKLIAMSLNKFVAHLTGFSIFADLDDYVNVNILKAVAENNIMGDSYETFVKIPYGASVIYNTDLMDEFCKSIDVEEVVILPCSSHEIICLPATPDVTENIDFFKALIKKVNNEELSYDTELSDRPYSYKMGGKVTKYDAERDQDMER